MDYVSRFPIISDQVDEVELRQILAMFGDVLRRKVSGDVVELGCYVGTTSLFLQRMILDDDTGRVLHVYDSFEGLPAKTLPDASPAGQQFVKGELKTAKSIFVRHFKHAGLPLPVIHKSWFDELSDADMPGRIAFAFLDGDFYESIKDSLRLVWPRLADGAMVVIDDYQSEALPGTKRAVDEWLVTHPARLRVVSSLAILTV